MIRPDHHIDYPASPSVIDTPQFELRGWLAVDPRLQINRVDIVDAKGARKPLHICRRTDVETARPNHTVLGLNQLLPTRPFANRGKLDGTVVISGTLSGKNKDFTFPVLRGCRPGAIDADSYYHSQDHLDDPNRPLLALSDEQREHWRQFGYLVLKRFFDPQTTENFNRYIDGMWTSRASSQHNLSIDAYVETANHQRIYFRDAPDEARSQPYKINDLFVTEPAVRELILEPSLVDLLWDLLDGPPVAANTLYMEYGSQQADHFDTFYMPPLIRNKMLATWIAFDDVDESNGPLRYYPGSHLIDPYVFSNGRYNETTEELPTCRGYIQSELEKRDISPVRFYAEKGDVFIWHAHLLHGGDKIQDPRKTRRSLVTHYFRTNELTAKEVLPHGEKGFYMNRPPAPVVLPSNRRNTFSDTIKSG